MTARCAARQMLCVAVLTLLSVAPAVGCELSVRIESDKQSSAAGAYNYHRLSRQSYALLTALLAKVSCQLKQQPLPAGRAIKMLEDGELAIMVGMSATEERGQYFYFVGPHHTERMVLVGPKAIAGRITSLTQILTSPGLISVTEGGYYGPKWQALLDKTPELQQRLFYASGNQQKLAMLASGRVMASMEDETVVDELLEQGGLTQRYTKLLVVHENPVYFAFSRKVISEQRYLQLQQSWQQMQQSGEVERIRNSF